VKVLFKPALLKCSRSEGVHKKNVPLGGKKLFGQVKYEQKKRKRRRKK